MFDTTRIFLPAFSHSLLRAIPMGKLSVTIVVSVKYSVNTLQQHSRVIQFSICSWLHAVRAPSPQRGGRLGWGGRGRADLPARCFTPTPTLPRLRGREEPRHGRRGCRKLNDPVNHPSGAYISALLEGKTCAGSVATPMLCYIGNHVLELYGGWKRGK